MTGTDTSPPDGPMLDTHRAAPRRRWPRWLRRCVGAAVILLLAAAGYAWSHANRVLPGEGKRAAAGVGR